MSALDRQVGGNHYKDMVIQPIEYILANKLGFVEGAVVKYVSRWRQKGGTGDLRKAIHLLEILIEKDVQERNAAESVKSADPRMPDDNGRRALDKELKRILAEKGAAEVVQSAPTWTSVTTRTTTPVGAGIETPRNFTTLTG